MQYSGLNISVTFNYSKKARHSKFTIIAIREPTFELTEKIVCCIIHNA